jgi:ribulose-5-phosphate 4-epimerase/fuculose-1-phosphate aldolase
MKNIGMGVNMNEEGVIKYQLHHKQTALGPELDVRELNAWRTVLYRLQLIGCKPNKYAGLGYGNISCRLPDDSGQFLISGTQTGDIAVLGKQHYALIHSASPQQNCIYSSGLTAPSSEALTHAGVYQQNPAIQAVIHVHCPELWHRTLIMQLPHTANSVAYGTPQMVTAVNELFSSGQLEQLPLFSMLGHEDGIVVFGPSLSAAASLLINILVKAIALE